jgi:hypothetical protein
LGGIIEGQGDSETIFQYLNLSEITRPVAIPTVTKNSYAHQSATIHG